MEALPIVGPIVGGLFGMEASDNAADAQRDAAGQASATQLKMFEQNRADLAPWRAAGTDALKQITAGLQPGGQFARRFSLADFQADPGYQFRLAEGQKALDRGAAARGLWNSGRQMKALTRFGQDTASNEFGNAYNRFRLDNSDIFNRYASAAGIGQTATSQLVQQGANTANNIAGNQLAAGNARASGYVGQANALTGAVGQGLNYWQNQQFLNKLPNPTSPSYALSGPVGWGRSTDPYSYDQMFTP